MCLFKPRNLNAIDLIKDKKNRPDIDFIDDYLTRTEASNVGKSLIEQILNELITQNVLINKKTATEDSFRVVINGAP